MHVGFLFRCDAKYKPGGDTIQFARYRDLGTELGLFTSELLVSVPTNPSRFDVFHLSNIDRPFDLYQYRGMLARSGIPFLISPIHHSYSDIEAYEKYGRNYSISSLLGQLSFFQLEALRTLVRSRRDARLLQALMALSMRPTVKFQMELLEAAKSVLCLAQRERDLLRTDIGFDKPATTVILPNGLDTNDALRFSKEGLRRSHILIVGRIEARKNQLAIIDALNILGLKGTFVGAINASHNSYVKEFTKKVHEGNHTYLGARSSIEVTRLMCESVVHISASWFEVASLVDLEAFAAGAKVIASLRGATKEILGDRAHYVEPDSTDSIVAALKTALGADDTVSWKNIVSNAPTWPSVVRQLFNQYQLALES